jgi:hypothetical protein
VSDADAQAGRPLGAEPSRCAECGAEVRCGARLGEARCWCDDLPALVPDPSLPDGACLCEACLRRRLEAQGS